ncbi:hypothetical protein [Capnocytophaga sp.]|uniref:hypothetical protein n=1 Tax=Capnocytophaga sp. TaxID=44737 RepID=UPI0026DC30E4|nr:hypothetical protein [Capnocytophaga sp.]MDO5104661.1 hypothetical protein [Capnocytophaga sp.]
MKNQFYLFISFVLCCFLASCSSVKLDGGTKNASQVGQINDITLIAKTEKIQHQSKKIGRFVLKEDFNIEWSNIRKKMTDFANANGGNLFEISEIGFGKKGHVFYVEGELCYNENLTEIRSQFDNTCAVNIIYPSFGAVLTFPVDIEIEKDIYKKVTYKEKAIRKEFADCNQETTIFVNKTKNIVKLNGMSKYFFIQREGGMTATAGGVGVSAGGFILTEIEDADFGRVMTLLH